VNGVLIEPVNNSDDKAPPTLLEITPSDNATGVAIDASITLTFNESIKAGKGNIVISNDTGTDLRYISVDDLSQVTLNGATLSINLTKNLLAGSNYSVTIESDAIKDLAGNKFAGILDSTDFNFTTLVGGSYLISGAGSTTTLTGIDTFNISSGEYTHIINGGFTIGDRLNFFPDAILNVLPDDDDADNSQSITATDPATGSVVTITFTNLNDGQDEGIYNLQSLKEFISVGTFAGTISGTTGQDTFTIAVGQNVSINNFSSGDTLKLFPNAILNIVPDANLTDGIKLANVSDPLTGATSVITLTGLTDAQDAGVFNMPSFLEEFGATSLVYV
jgi:methionine-rich copper-binding protein CopC